MSKARATLRRSTAILAVSVGMMAISGPGATAASSLPKILSGKADSQALRIQLTLPGVDQLKATLIAAGIPVSGLPDTNLGGITIDEKISLNHGEVTRNISGAPNKASGFATAITGVLPIAGELTRSVSSSCTSSGCTKGAPVSLIDTDLPAGIGHLQVAGATSVTKNLLDTRNGTALAQAHIDLKSLIAKGAPLAAVGDALRTLTDTVNSTVLPPVNGALATLEGTLGDTLEQNAPELKKQLDAILTLGTIKDLPDLSKVSLADLTVLGAKSDVFPKTVDGFKGLQAVSAGKVTDIKLLGGWASVDAVGINTASYANGVKGAAAASADVQIAGLNLGGLLGIDIDRTDLQNLTDPESLKAAIRDAAAKAGLEDQAEDLVGAIDLMYSIAGIDIEYFGVTKHVDPKGRFADATAGTLAIIVEPKVPVASSMVTLPGRTVPTFTKFVSTGVRLRIDLPNASTAVAAGNVLGRSFSPPRSKSGVGTPFIAAFLLMGAAVVVRKYAMAK